MRDAQTLLLYDVSLWGDEHARAVRARFPECDVSCMANGNSMSGFVVMIARGPCLHGRRCLWWRSWVRRTPGWRCGGI